VNETALYSDRYQALNNLQNFSRINLNLISGKISLRSVENTTNKSLALIAINANVNLDFRFSAFRNLKKKRISSKQLENIQNAITETLLKIIQNQPENRLNAIQSMRNEVLETLTKTANAQIITSVLTQIMLNKLNTGEIRYRALIQLQDFTPKKSLIPRKNQSKIQEITTNESLVIFALNPNEDLDFRLRILTNLEDRKISFNKLSKSKIAITNDLFKTLLNRFEDSGKRLDAVYGIRSIYGKVIYEGAISPEGQVRVESPMKPTYVKIIAPVLKQIALNTNNSEEIRYGALQQLYYFDIILAKKIEKDVPIPPPIPIPQGGGTPIVRAATVTRLKSAPPAVCRYPGIRKIFAWKCRRLVGV
jgi:hypothetical protein